MSRLPRNQICEENGKIRCKFPFVEDKVCLLKPNGYYLQTYLSLLLLGYKIVIFPSQECLFFGIPLQP